MKMPNTAHTDNAHAAHFAPHDWRVVTDSGSDPYFRDEHSCSYCGSVSIPDLLRHLRAGGRVSLADMKYGYPHKLYIDDVPNAKYGKRIVQYQVSHARPDDDESWEYYDTGTYNTSDGSKRMAWRKETESIECPAVRTVKFYTEHLCDATDEEMQELNTYFVPDAKVTFAREAETGRIKYTLLGGPNVVADN